MNQTFYFSSLDVLVNCAGILVLGTVDSHTTADFDRVMNLNTRSGQQSTQSGPLELLIRLCSLIFLIPFLLCHTDTAQVIFFMPHCVFMRQSWCQ